MAEELDQGRSRPFRKVHAEAGLGVCVEMLLVSLLTLEGEVGHLPWFLAKRKHSPAQRGSEVRVPGVAGGCSQKHPGSDGKSSPSMGGELRAETCKPFWGGAAECADENEQGRSPELPWRSVPSGFLTEVVRERVSQGRCPPKGKAVPALTSLPGSSRDVCSGSSAPSEPARLPRACWAQSALLPPRQTSPRSEAARLWPQFVQIAAEGGLRRFGPAAGARSSAPSCSRWARGQLPRCHVLCSWCPNG